jgi:flagella basal body P-ring formation protein FlgA
LRADRRRAPWTRLARVAAVWLVVGAPAWAQTTADVDAAVAVATRSVREVFGGDAEVTLSAPVLSLAGDASQIATAIAEPQSRTAGPVRFVLYAAGETSPRRLGRLTARVDVRATHLRTRDRVPARHAFSPADVVTVRDDIGRQPFSPLPTLAALTGAMARRALLADDVLTAAAIVERALVTSGDEVVTVARVGGLEVRGRAIAAQSGGLGDTVIVVNPDSRRRLRARVVADAEVEVVHGS